MQDTKGWAHRMAGLDKEDTPKPKTEIILIRESFWSSIVSDTYTFLVVVGIISIGWLLQSTAMQWAGFLMLMILGLGKIVGKTPRLTVAEARAKLDEFEKK